jgi:uncharacterized membrane protein YccC
VANVDALKSAARAAMVASAVFAFADEVIGRPQTSLFAAFGSFAFLVLAEFGGRQKTRLLAYGGLGVVGALFVCVGTVCSRTPWLGAVAMAAFAFLTLFSGAFSGYLAAGSAGAILAFVLSVNVPARNSAIPDRLLGWALAAAVGTAAVMLVWPPRRRADLRRAAAGAIRTVADLLEADADPDGGLARRAREAVDGLGRKSLGAQHRPAGQTSATAALAALPDELDWLLSFLTPGDGRAPVEPARDEEVEALAAAAAVLRANAERLDGGDAQPDFARLDEARSRFARGVARSLPELPAEDDAALLAELDLPFRIRALTYAARQAAEYTLRATAGDLTALGDVSAAHAHGDGSPAERSRLFAAEHASLGSVWLQNSLRGAVALAVATYIAQRTNLQHGFWVVLGTLSVLRSNALGTGWSIVSALAGTAAGIVAGAGLVLAIGTHQAVLWAVFPLALLLAAYAPRAISFAAGQAGFTVLIFVLFNLIQPVGWQVGVVRVEDVAIGFAISLGVGLLFWPRGAGALLRGDLAAAYSASADYVAAATRQLIEHCDPAETKRAARGAATALHRLNDAFAQYLAERSASSFDVEDVAALVGGAVRVNRAAESLMAIASMVDPETRLDQCGGTLSGELTALHTWYVTLGHTIVNEQPAPPPHVRDVEGRRRLLECVRAEARTKEKRTLHAWVALVATLQHLENLRRLEMHVAERANATRPASPERGLLVRLGLAS